MRKRGVSQFYESSLIAQVSSEDYSATKTPRFASMVTPKDSYADLFKHYAEGKPRLESKVSFAKDIVEYQYIEDDIRRENSTNDPNEVQYTFPQN